MDRRRAVSPLFSRQQSAGSNSSGSSSPGMSPAHHRRSGSAFGTSLPSFRRTQNLAARAANARLAQVMASQAADDGDDDDANADADAAAAADLQARASFRFAPPRPAVSSNGGGGGSLFRRSARSPSPALGRNFVEPTPTIRSASSGRPSLTVRTTLVPPSKPTLRSASPIPMMEPPVDRRWDRRSFADVGHQSSREPSDLSEELDLLQEENENLLEKLRLAEERSREAEARSRELEKQVATLGEGVSLEARLLSRKEAALRQREEAVKAAMLTKDDKSEEVSSLRQQVQSARDEVAAAVEKLKEAESETQALRSMTHRMILTEEEMEEVVLKRCWLARYWGLAVRHGIYPEIASSKHEHWSSLAPLPVEVVISAGQRAKEESWSQGDGDSERRNKLIRDLNDITGEGNIESMLLVEKGLRELASLKVEDAVVFAMAQHRGLNLLRQSNSAYAGLRSPNEAKVMEAFELSEEEVEDVLFKQAWLTYIWRRAKTHGVEEDIAEERLQFWIGRTGQSLTCVDYVDVERGLMELRKLGIEELLWEASRREIDSNQKLPSDAEDS